MTQKLTAAFRDFEGHALDRENTTNGKEQVGGVAL
jgi:hypothetical protein